MCFLSPSPSNQHSVGWLVQEVQYKRTKSVGLRQKPCLVPLSNVILSDECPLTFILSVGVWYKVCVVYSSICLQPKSNAHKTLVDGGLLWFISINTGQRESA